MTSKKSTTKAGRKRGPKSNPSFQPKLAKEYGIATPDKLPPADRLISPNEAGELLDLTGEAIKQWIYTRRLPAVKLSNGYWRIKVGDLMEFVNARNQSATRRILVVISGDEDASKIEQTIQNLGYEVLISYNVADAILKSVDLIPALFIVSLDLPKGSSWKLIDRIRRTRNIKTIPILVMSKKEIAEEDSERLLDLDVQGFLESPLNPKTLSAEIANTLERIK